MKEFNKNPINYIYSELSYIKQPYHSLPYPRGMRSPLYDGLRCNELYNRGKGEHHINKNDIVIFDTICPTIMHYCIEFNIIFIVITTREDVSHYTDQYKEYFVILKKMGFAFFDDEKSLLGKKITEIINPNYNPPIEWSDYLYDTFINI